MKLRKRSLSSRLKFTIKNIPKFIKFSNKVRNSFNNQETKSFFEIFKDLMLVSFKYRVFYSSYCINGIHKQGKSISDYLVSNEFRELRNKKNSIGQNSNFDYRCLLRDKALFENLLNHYNLPTPKNIGSIDKNKILYIFEDKKEYEIIKLLGLKFDGFVKNIDGEEGDGVFSLKIEDRKLIFDHEEMNIELFKEKLDGEFILQERIIQHQEMNNIYSEAVNTLRVITFMTKTGPIVFDSFLRIGVDGNDKDNLSQGGVLVLIDEKNGKLMGNGLIRDDFRIKEIDVHPDSGTVFNNYKLPYLLESINIALKAHNSFSNIHSIGWDIAITENGPIILEGNDNWSILSPQSHSKDGLKKKFYEYHNL